MTTIIRLSQSRAQLPLGPLFQSSCLRLPTPRVGLCFLFRAGSIDLINALSRELDLPNTYPSALAETESVERAQFLVGLGYTVATAHCVAMNTDYLDRQPYRACIKGDLEMISLFAKQGFDFNLPNPEGITCLMLAADANRPLVIRKLAGELHVDVDRRDPHGANALMYAVDMGALDSIRELVRFGADVNAVIDENWTALASAIEFAPNRGTRRLLHALGARRNIQPEMKPLVAIAMDRIDKDENGSLDYSSAVGDWLSWRHAGGALV